MFKNLKRKRNRTLNLYNLTLDEILRNWLSLLKEIKHCIITKPVKLLLSVFCSCF